MDTQIPLRALAQLAPAELTAASNELFIANHRRELQRALHSMGYERIEFPAEEPSFARRFEEAEPHWPDILATQGKQNVCICLAPAATHTLALEALSPEQCACCEQHFPKHEVHFAALIAAPQEQKLYLIGPIAVRLNGQWQEQTPEQAQFLPFSRRTLMDRYSPLLGGCALIKLNRLLIPHALEHGQLPRFAVRGLFEDKEQGSHGIYALMSEAPPTHFMLVEREPATGELCFRRPFFFYGERPHAELELMRCSENAPGLVELLDKTGRTLYAESLETILFPGEIATGRHYKWTLSLVADRCRPLKKEFALASGPMLEQAKRDYARQHGSEPPADFSVRVSTAGMRTLFQESRQAYTELCGRVSHAEEIRVDGQQALLLSICPIPHNDDVEVQVFAGLHILGATRPQEGDVLECAGFLYASPDAVVEAAESWQDSGEVAALQEAREQEMSSLNAYQLYSGYSLAQGVVAATFAKAGYSLLAAPGAHTREDATFLVQDAEGQHKRLLFVDTLMGDAEAQFAYTKEQRQSILARYQATHGSALCAHHCTVRLRREAGSENYTVQLKIEPECPGIDPTRTICDATQCPLPGKLSEAVACRIICNAICSQDWGEFARTAAEDVAYESLVNGTRTLGKIEYIRYMAERKQLWEEQMGWPGMRMETGTISYKGEKRACFMITCYGQRIGAEVVSLRGGFIAAMETVPLEANDSYEPDAESEEQPRIFHPLRGRLYAYTERQSPLQRFATAYLQECMARKTGICGAEDDSHRQVISGGGVEFRLEQRKGARWLKLLRNGPSPIDLAFSHAGSIYAVKTVEVEEQPDAEGKLRSIAEAMPERDKLLALAEEHGLIPCIFPAMRGYMPDPESSWNLWDLRTLQPLCPERAHHAPAAPPSHWEMLNAALAELKAIAEHHGLRVLGCHDIPELLPHFWFYDAHGQLSWIIVRTHTDGAHVDRAESEAERLAMQLTRGTRGYAVDVTAWADPQCTSPARSGDLLHLRLSEPLPLEEA